MTAWNYCHATGETDVWDRLVRGLLLVNGSAQSQPAATSSGLRLWMATARGQVLYEFSSEERRMASSSSGKQVTRPSSSNELPLELVALHDALSGHLSPNSTDTPSWTLEGRRFTLLQGNGLNSLLAMSNDGRAILAAYLVPAGLMVVVFPRRAQSDSSSGNAVGHGMGHADWQSVTLPRVDRLAELMRRS